jgi:hypothetical protein
LADGVLLRAPADGRRGRLVIHRSWRWWYPAGRPLSAAGAQQQ